MNKCITDILDKLLVFVKCGVLLLYIVHCIKYYDTACLSHGRVYRNWFGFFFISLFFFTLVWAGELPIWLTELHAFLSLLCLFGWEFELVKFMWESITLEGIHHSSVYESFSFTIVFTYGNIVTATLFHCNRKYCVRLYTI